MVETREHGTAFVAKMRALEMASNGAWEPGMALMAEMRELESWIEPVREEGIKT